MSRLRAPSALRRPISRVRSLTTISMMFMMTMPPTTSDRPTTPMSTENAPAVKARKMFMIVSDVYMPKLSGSFGPSLRSDAQRDAGLVHRPLDLHRVARLDRQLEAAARSEQLLEGAERDRR